MSDECPILEAKLEACPHCGYHSGRLFYNANNRLFFVYCEVCHTITAPHIFKDYAVASWNNRNEENKKRPAYKRERPCVFSLGEFCWRSELPVYTKDMCEACRRQG